MNTMSTVREHSVQEIFVYYDCLLSFKIPYLCCVAANRHLKMLCYMIICIAPLPGGYSEALSRYRQEKRSLQTRLRKDASDIPCGITFQSAGPIQQRTGSGIEKYGTNVQEDHSEQQSAADERSGQITVYT